MIVTNEIFPGVAQVSSRFTGILLDAYGVFGVVMTLDSCQDQKKSWKNLFQVAR
jgi:hypothetical protein